MTTNNIFSTDAYTSILSTIGEISQKMENRELAVDFPVEAVAQAFISSLIRNEAKAPTWEKQKAADVVNALNKVIQDNLDKS